MTAFSDRVGLPIRKTDGIFTDLTEFNNAGGATEFGVGWLWIAGVPYWSDGSTITLAGGGSGIDVYADFAAFTTGGGPAAYVDKYVGIGTSVYYSNGTNVSISGSTRNTQAAAFTASRDHLSKVQKITSATDINVTLPAESTGGWIEGDTILLLQASTGIPTFVAGAGVTVNNPGSVISAQYFYISAQYEGSDVWTVRG